MDLQDVGSEKAVLAGVYQYGNDALIDIADIINSNSFTIEENQALYLCLEQALKDNKSIDLTAIITTAERMGLEKRIIKEKKDIAYLRALCNFPIKLENVRGYAKRLAKLEFARKAQERHKQAFDELGKIKGSESIDEILAISEGTIFDLIQEINQGKNDQPQLIAEGSNELLQHLIDNPSDMAGLPSPFPCYNTIIGGGFRRGGVNLICSRPKVGKTTCGKEISLHFTMNLKVPVLFLDTEMVKNDQLFRSLSSLSGVETNRIETGQFGQNEDEKERVFRANEKLKGVKFYHTSIAGKQFEEVLSIIRRWIVKEVGYDENGNTKDCLVMYDYFKLMTPDSLETMQEYQALGFQISRLSDFCKEYDFACLAFVQVNRDGIRRETSDIISQSDRLLWLCHSITLFKRKERDEIIQNGIQGGTHKLVFFEDGVRFGPGLINDYISIEFNGAIAKIKELGLQSKLNELNTINEEGFINNVQPGDDLYNANGED